MKIIIKLTFTALILCSIQDRSTGQTLYFPPPGNAWEAIDPVVTLGWCPQIMDEMHHFLDTNGTKAFIILQDGRIALEWYFDTFTKDSVWYWASAGKSLTSLLAGIAIQEGLIDIHAPSHQYLGKGWSSCSEAEEDGITVRHHLTMTTGLDDKYSGNSDCTDPECLSCLAPPGTRWAYHNAAYTLMERIISNATGLTLNQYFNQRIGSKIGAIGAYIPLGYNRVFFSKARDMARVGLLVLANGIWNSIPVMTDTAYMSQMSSSSQDINKSYGYLWWLNGKGEYMLPGIQFKFPGNLIPKAPVDLFAGLGKDDQKLYIVPSQNRVVIRLGNAAGAELPALSSFDNALWDYIQSLPCASNIQNNPHTSAIRIQPNPASEAWNIQGLDGDVSWQLWHSTGQLITTGFGYIVPASIFPAGSYLLVIETEGMPPVIKRLIKTN